MNIFSLIANNLRWNYNPGPDWYVSGTIQGFLFYEPGVGQSIAVPAGKISTNPVSAFSVLSTSFFGHISVIINSDWNVS